MRPSRKLSSNLLIVFACIAVLVMRIGGAHLHLCFDGSEAPSALHFADAGLHHQANEGGHHAAEAHHDDLEVKVAADAVTKLPTLDLPILAGLLALAFALLFAGRSPVPERPAAFRSRRALPYLRPPLRGPPRSSFV